ncbi:MAG: HDOD domain-containing protein [Candidatus Eisenbacteria bacterium]|uniref:HDOD domain-containing protein n=1 Tax=Eiseniibacteriota bacterium TaxID=2212470 RepID=A0A948RRS7_UNCEI|nr:HDOD domain-containing protein [Candidatus Eisenbacteria bacterium]MBU1949765.1 HDOD domain-containing protein [Candidatus Eisenbacteria bacterium]MBU2689406.1 HDOD domain-containing protein [Candidatus Eisenbacteria bacterium]
MTEIIENNALARVQNALGERDYLSPVPHAIARLWEVIDRPETTVDHLTQIVESDPSLTVNLLRIVNSVSFGLRRKLVNVRDAIIYAGLSELKNLSIALVVQTGLLLRKPYLTNFDVDLVWRHSVGTGILARHLARQTRAAKPETAFVTGLLHNVGWIILDQVIPERVAEILGDHEDSEEGSGPSEFRHLGFTHADAGAWLIQQWKLPKILSNAVQYHHQPHAATTHRKLTTLLYVADTLTAQVVPYIPQFPPIGDPPEEFWRELDMSPAAGIPAIGLVEKELEKVMDLLRVT